MPTYDIAIRNGIVVDGARHPRFRADVGIANGVIAKIGRIGPGEAAREIDATGLVVAPGFIDLHTHYDAQVFWDPYLTTSGWNGVTSVVIGNCGFGFAPCRAELRERAMASMTKVEAIPLATMQAALPWDWETYPQMLDSIDRMPKAVNVLPYVGVNPLLIWVLGLDDAKAGRKPTDSEHAAMARLLDEAMDAGACGWSTQTLGTPGDPSKPTLGGAAQSDFDGTPMPSDVMWPETHEVLARVLGRRGEGFIEMSAAGMPREHWERIAELSGAPVIYQAMPASPLMLEMNAQILAWMDDCRSRGLRLYAQGITQQDPPLVFTFDYWDLWGPVWEEFTGPTLSREAKLANLADPAVREKLRAQPLKVPFIAGVNEARIVETHAPAAKAFVGKTVQELADAKGQHPVDALCDLVVADELRTVLAAPQFDIDDAGLAQLVADPYVLPGLSDGGAHIKYLAAGCYATEYIAKHVRERGLSSLEDAHWRLSALPAHCAGFRNRGVLREGAAADVLVYDYEALDYEFPTFRHDLPGGEYRVAAAGRGYRYVLVNGQVTIEDDRETGTHSGALLRHGA